MSQGPKDARAPEGRHVSTGQSVVSVAAACLVLAVGNALLVALPSGWDVAAAACATVGVVAGGRWCRLSWSQLGLARDTWLPGVRWGLLALLLVAAFYLLTLAVPLGRDTTNDLAAPTGANVWVTAFVLIPLRTVIFEELTFRGVLWGLIERQSGPRWALFGTAVAFGFWHLAPAFSLAQRTESVAWSAVLGVVAFTTGAGLLLGWLRQRSGSVLAPAALHWATNSLGLIAAYLA